MSPASTPPDKRLNPDAPTCRATMVTPVGRGAIATVLVEGPDATAVVNHFFRTTLGLPLEAISCGRIVFGHWRTPSSREETIVCRRTADLIEIHCHGGRAAPQAVLHSLRDHGCQSLPWQEFFGTSDSISAEATEALSRSETERTAAILLEQHDGVLSGELRTVRRQLTDRRPDEALQRLTALLDNWPFGEHLTQPWQVVVAGAPNVGKSSLVNALLGFQRSIVTGQAGTTRDLVVADTVIDGWPIRLIDTAGLRSAPSRVEEQGIALAQRQMRAADLVVEIRDLSVAPNLHAASESVVDRNDYTLQAFTEGVPVLTVWNKCDLERGTGTAPPALSTSALTGFGIGKLIDTIGQRLVPHPPAASTPVLFTSRQRNTVKAAVACILDNRLDLAAQYLHRLCS